MKKFIYQAISILLIFTFVLAGCGKSSKNKVDLISQDCIYYKGTNGLYAENANSGNKQLLVSGDIKYLQRTSEYVFYFDNDNEKLCSINIQTGKSIQYNLDFSILYEGQLNYDNVFEDVEFLKTNFIKATDAYIYYAKILSVDINKPPNMQKYTRYCMKLDGTQEKQLDNDYVWHCGTNDNKMFYVRTTEYMKQNCEYVLYESNFDGTKERKISDVDDRAFRLQHFAVISKNYLYYYITNDIIYRINIQTGKLETIRTDMDFGASIIGTENGYLYLRMADATIYRLNEETLGFGGIYDYMDHVVFVPITARLLIQNNYLLIYDKDGNYRRKIFEDDSCDVLEKI